MAPTVAVCHRCRGRDRPAGGGRGAGRANGSLAKKKHTSGEAGGRRRTLAGVSTGSPGCVLPAAMPPDGGGPWSGVVQSGGIGRPLVRIGDTATGASFRHIPPCRARRRALPAHPLPPCCCPCGVATAPTRHRHPRHHRNPHRHRHRGRPPPPAAQSPVRPDDASHTGCGTLGSRGRRSSCPTRERRPPPTGGRPWDPTPPHSPTSSCRDA